VDRKWWPAAALLASLALGRAASATLPLGLPPDFGDATPPSQAMVQLGGHLFQDKRLSVDGKVSCATCHLPEHLFADARATARARERQMLSRHTPSLLNVRYQKNLFWDGRTTDLAAQARIPLLGPSEHGLPDESSLVRIVGADPTYAAAFKHLFGANPDSLSVRQVGTAIAAYERTLLAGDSPFDRYLYGRDTKAMSPAAIRGLDLFRGRAQCGACHLIGERSAMFNDDGFHESPLRIPESTLAELGRLTEKVTKLREKGATDVVNALIATDADIASLGRFVATLDPRDIGRFKTPSLRNVALLGPYMHDGSVTTLSQAIEIELYRRGSANYPLVLTADERGDLLEFLRALSSKTLGN
jgi:cytochrome c peroxidase